MAELLEITFFVDQSLPALDGNVLGWDAPGEFSVAQDMDDWFTGGTVPQGVANLTPNRRDHTTVAVRTSRPMPN